MHHVRAAANFLEMVFAEAAEQRHLRPDGVDGPDGPELEWVAYERSCMHEAVNSIRSENGLPPVPVEEIIKVERLASGHSDYRWKFAFYSAEIAVGATA